MRANQKSRRRHGEQFKAQVLAACAEPGASVSAVALSFGLNANLVHQWRRGRGYNENRMTTAEGASASFNQGRFCWPDESSSVPQLTREQVDALVLGLPWQRLEQMRVIARV